MGEVIQGLFLLFAKHPKLAGLFGLIVAIVFGILGLSAWNGAQKMPSTPTHITLNQIAATIKPNEEVWVEIDKVKWDCTNIVYTYSGIDLKTEAVFTDDTNSILGVAHFSLDQKPSCGDLNEINVKGTLLPMTDIFYSQMAGRGFQLAKYKNSAIRINLSTFGGPGNSQLLIFISLVMVLLGLALYPLCLYLKNRYPEVGNYEHTLYSDFQKKIYKRNDRE